MRLIHITFILIVLLSSITALAQKKKVPGLNYLTKSNQYHDKKDYTRALLYINKALAKDSLNPFYYHNRGIIYSDMGLQDKAIADVEKAVRLDTNYANFHNTLASIYMRTDNPAYQEKIIQHMNRAIELDPGDAISYFNRGIYYMNQEQMEQALNDFYKARDLDPKMAQAYFEIGRIKEGKMQYHAEAKIDFTKAIELNPNKAEYYSGRAGANLNLGDLENSEKDILKALSIDPYDLTALLTQSNLYSMQGKMKEALTILDGIITRDSTSWEAYNDRGLIKAFRMNNPEEGIIDFFKASKLRPTEYMIRNNIGLCYNELGQYEEAVKEFDVAIAHLPEFAFSYNNRGYAKMKAKDYQGAFSDINQSIKLDPKNSYAFRNRALVYLDMNRPEDACLDLNHALELKFTIFYGPEVQELIQKYCTK